MGAQHLHDLVSHTDKGVQRVGILVNDRYLGSTNFPKPACIETAQISPHKLDGTFDDISRERKQLHQRLGSRGLAGARFSEHANNLPTTNGETNPPDYSRLAISPQRHNIDAQVAHAT